MEFLADIYNLLPPFVWNVLSLLTSLSVILFMNFSSKYRNVSLRFTWYIAALFFPFIIFIIYLSKRRAYKNIKVKVCENCGDTHPVNFEYCNRCLAKLPEYDEKKKAQQKFLATLFAVLFALLFLFNFVGNFTVVTQLYGDYFSDYTEEESRIGFEGSDGYTVYYDRNGEEYYDVLEVVLYDREGNKYYYSYEGQECFYKDDGKVSLWEEDDYIPVYDCFVDEEGYFVDKSDEYDLIIIIEEETESQYYFETPYTDGEGNLYYPAMSASWNAEGELITSQEQMN